MEKPDTILIIGGRLEAIQKAKELGLRVVFLQHKERLLPGQAEAVDVLLLVDYLDWNVTRPIVRAAHEAYGFTAVMTLVEQATELAGRINDMLGLGGTSYEVARRFHDKLRMREWLHRTGFESVGCAEVKSAEEIRRFGEQHGFPVVVKPMDGTASRGIAVVRGPEETEGAWAELTGLRGRGDLPMATFYPVDRFIAEEYIDGVEYSVESFSFDGHHIVVSITDKFHDGCVEMGHALPAILEDEKENTIVRHVTGFLTAMGLKDGVGHTEVKLSAKGPRIIEGHDRVAGDRLLDFMAVTHGFDMEKYASGWPFRRLPALTERPVPTLGAATKWVNGRPGIVEGVEGVEELRSEAGVFGVDVHVRPGEEITAMTDNYGRHVQVLVTAETTAAAVERIDALIDRVRVVTRPASS
ncbi:ATP-grasp domain-containing protein [Streptomyces sp. WMMC940]|uniref:ATP-grasp domain-containing protein n=1 Tax=Streptomyces sp. WMMC940 TaxID=3015153 RepID=UPI0022B61F73|nr:ATP-grasp domain-containing protein [Streptomyces sp. WMMC940]MCZ7462273.1 ATP-grasp domain-containing protein [Streptomyces sp. WMMC940]